MDRWYVENNRLKLAYITSGNATDAEDIRVASNCSFADAWRLASIKYIASSELIRDWLRGDMTWVRLWRIASRHPCDPDAQLREAKARKMGPLRIG